MPNIPSGSLSSWYAVATAVLLGVVSTAPASAQVANCPFNVSAGTGGPRLTVDGLLLTRYALGLRGNALVAGIRPGLTSSTIESFIADHTQGLDVDADWRFELNDATLIARAMAGFQGEALTAGLDHVAVAKRTTAGTISEYLAAGCPTLRILTHPAPVTAAVGQSASFTVTHDGVGPYRYNWYYRDDQGNATRLNDCTTATCTVNPVVAASAGRYSVQVYDKYSTNVPSELARLTIAVAPSITQQPASVSVNVGASATFSVVANGTAPLSYSWLRGTGSNPTTPIAGCTGASCTLSNVQLADNASTVRVRVGNAVGSVDSNVVTLTVNGSSNEVNAQSCGRDDVQAALTTANQRGPGTVVNIPGGYCNWTDKKQVRVNAGIIIRGAGRDTTILHRTGAVPRTMGYNDTARYMLRINCSNGGTVEMSGITFRGNDDEQTDAQKNLDEDSGVTLEESCKDFKIHDMRFEKFSNAALSVEGNDSRGVIYGNIFRENYKCAPSSDGCLGYGVVVYGSTSGGPEMPLALGSENVVFIEDNDFAGDRHSVAANLGARYVFRHNVVTQLRGQPWRWFSPVDAHGYTGGNGWGTRSFEIYDNEFRMASGMDGPPATMGLRGGDGVVFCNKFGPGSQQHVNPIISVEDYTTVVNGQTKTITCKDMTYPTRSQMRRGYFWQNTGNVMNAGKALLSAYGNHDVECERILKPERDYFNRAPNRAANSSDPPEFKNYTPARYPHSLRGMPAQAATACSW